MPANMEIKARIGDLQETLRKAEALSAARPTLLIQQDTFYLHSPLRIKLRRQADEKPVLILYRRANKTGPKQSKYVLIPPPFSTVMAAILSAFLGVRGRLRKTRRLYLADNTRIHVDQVEGLGDFLEFEVVLSDAFGPEQGKERTTQLLDYFSIADGDLIDRSYVELAAAKGVKP